VRACVRALVKAKSRGVDARARAREAEKKQADNNNQRSDPCTEPVERHFVGPVFRVSSVARVCVHVQDARACERDGYPRDPADFRFRRNARLRFRTGSSARPGLAVGTASREQVAALRLRACVRACVRARVLAYAHEWPRVSRPRGDPGDGAGSRVGLPRECLVVDNAAP